MLFFDFREHGHGSENKTQVENIDRTNKAEESH